MYEELRNKKVKMIVGTNSGVALLGSVATASGTLIIVGTFESDDNDMIKVVNATISGFALGENVSSGLVRKTEAIVDETSAVYINKKNVILIEAID